MTPEQILIEYTDSSCWEEVADINWTSSEVLAVMEEYGRAHGIESQNREICEIRVTTESVTVPTRAIRTSYTLEEPQPLQIEPSPNLSIHCDAVEEVTRGKFYVSRLGRDITVNDRIVTVDDVRGNRVVCVRKVTYLDEYRHRVYCNIEATSHPDIASFERGWGQFIKLRTIKRRTNRTCFITERCAQAYAEYTIRTGYDD